MRGSGGIVIWHIDEKIINEKINENAVNAVMNMKGVDVEEADGIQDIGQSFSSVFGTSIGEGSREDFWYKGNPSKFYKNSFLRLQSRILIPTQAQIV